MVGGTAHAMQDPARLSFRQPMFSNVDAWRAVARARFRELYSSETGRPKRKSRLKAITEGSILEGTSLLTFHQEV